jgi:aminomethyltransferase
MTMRRTPYYSLISALGAQMGRVGGGFMSALNYGNAAAEHLNTRANVGLQDLSTMGKVDIRGPDAEALVNYVVVADVTTMETGQVRYSTVCTAEGGIMDDLTIFRLGEAHFMLVTGSVNRTKMRDWLVHHAESRRAYVTDRTAAIAFPTIQGPRARDLLEVVVTEVDLTALRRWRFARGRIGEIEVMVSRTGVTGELGFELFVSADEAATVWNEIFAIGGAFGLRPYGVQAMFTLGLEKLYPAHGLDMDERRTPFHIGLDRFIRFEKGEFIGRDALLRLRDTGVAEAWVGLLLEGDTTAVTDARVMVQDEEVGYITYSDRGHSIGAVLATAHVRTDYAASGTTVSVMIGGAPVTARVMREAFLDPEGLRLRA